MLSEVRQRNTNIIWFHFIICGLKKKKTKQQTQRYSEYTGGYQKRWEVGEIGEGG